MDGIVLNQIGYTYPGAKTAALRDVNLTISRNQWTTLIGKNGSGKSTIARLIDGLLVPIQGTITVNGLAVTEENLSKLHQRVGIVFQNPENQFVGATVADDIAFGLENQQVPREKMAPLIQQALQKVGMAHLAGAEPGMLSGGQKQRVAIAGILALHPQILILDEATSMLDPEGRRTVLNLLNQLRKQEELTIISITHDPIEMELADQVAVIDKHHVVEVGPALEILQKTALLKELGVGIPTGQLLRDMLAAKGVAVPQRYFTEDEMVEWLWQKLN